jgi:exonuclease III
MLPRRGRLCAQAKRPCEVHSLLSLVSWNVAGRVRRLAEQALRVISFEPDLICLQEVSARTAPMWRQALGEFGWPFVEVAPFTAARTGGRRALSVLVAARSAFEVRSVHGVPWPERVLCAHVHGLELINLHSPISPSPGLAKVITHEAVRSYLSQRSGPRVLCGDLNTPRREHPDGRVWTFARDRYGKLRPERGERWDDAELALIKGLEQFGFRDAFRAEHGYEQREPSWVWQRWGGGYRLDHLIVSEDVQVESVGYMHEWRDEGLSDHSALVARVGVRALAV